MLYSSVQAIKKFNKRQSRSKCEVVSLSKYRKKRIKRHVKKIEFKLPAIIKDDELKKFASAAVFIAALSFPAARVYALPQNGTVTYGTANINTVDTQMTITQSTTKAIINWDRFNIDVNELVKFIQPATDSIALNRVVGTDPSSILGQLQANGRIFLVNPNGIVFGENAKVDVAGLVATTFDIKDEDFINENYIFEQNSDNALAQIINKGEIRVADNGFVFLVAPAVSNEGYIVAHLGKVVMASGDKFEIDFNGDGLITYTIEGEVAEKVLDANGNPLITSVKNSGSIKADGGTVLLKGSAVDGIFEEIVNNEGVIEANSIDELIGKVKIDGGNAGKVVSGGKIDVSSEAKGLKGGEVKITGYDIEQSGEIRADGIDFGDAGTIYIYATNQSVVKNSSKLSARGVGESSDGGFIEVSAGNFEFIEGGVFNTGAENGQVGLTLFDPLNLVSQTITATGDLSYTAEDSVKIEDSTITTTDGDITVSAPNIEITGSTLSAQVNTDATKGNIEIKAELAVDSNNTDDLESFLNNVTQVSITITDSTINASSNVDIIANIVKADDLEVNEDNYDDIMNTDSRTPAGKSVYEVGIEVQPLFGGAPVSATIDIKSDTGQTVITGKDISIKAASDSETRFTLVGVGVGISYVETAAEAKVTVDGDVQIDASNNLEIESLSKMFVDITARTYSLTNIVNKDYNITFAYTSSDITSKVDIGQQVVLSADNDMSIAANSFEDMSTKAITGSYTSGKLGIAVTFTNSTNDTEALIGGSLDVGNNLDIVANVEIDKNRTTASAGTGSNKYVDKYVFHGLQSGMDKFNSFIGNKANVNSKTTVSKLALSAALAYADHSITSNAQVKEGAQIKAGDLTLNSKVDYPDGDNSDDVGIRIAAIGTVDSAANLDEKENAIAGAISIAEFSHDVKSSIESSAVTPTSVDVTNTLSIYSNVNLPENITWDNFDDVNDIFNYTNTNLGLQNGVFTTWAQSNASANEIGVAGSVNIFSVDNDVKSYIGNNALINQNTDARFRDGDQNVKVESEILTSTLNLGGVFGITFFGTSDRKGVGGAYNGVEFENTNLSYIDDNVQIYAGSLAVTSKTTTRQINIAEAGGKANDLTINGSFGYSSITNQTSATIKDNVVLKTGDEVVENTDDNLLIFAEDTTSIYNVVGGFSWSKDGGDQGVAVGASVGINEINRDTEAGVVGNKSDGVLTDITNSGDINIFVTNDGYINSWAIAAAAVAGQGEYHTDTPNEDPLDGFSIPNLFGEKITTGFAIAGDFSQNVIDDTGAAYLIGANVNSQGDMDVVSDDKSSILSVAGAATFTSTDNSIGIAGSCAITDISNDTSAYILDSILNFGSNDITVDGKNDNEIKSIAAGGSLAKTSNNTSFSGALAGSVGINFIDSSVESYVSQSNVQSVDELFITAEDDSNILSVAGAAQFGAGNGVGAAVSINKFNVSLNAYAKDSNISATGDLKIISDSDTEVDSIAAAGESVGGDNNLFAIAGAASLNYFQGDVLAYLSDSSDSTINAGSLYIEAKDDVEGDVVAGEIAGGSSASVGLGATAAYNESKRNVKAYIDGYRNTNVSGNVDVRSHFVSNLDVVAVGGSQAKTIALAGSGVINFSENDVEAYINSSVIFADTAVVEATEDNDIAVYGGTITINSEKNAAGVGATATVNVNKDTVKSYIASSEVHTKGNATSNVSNTTDEGGTVLKSGLIVVADVRNNVSVWTASITGVGSSGLKVAGNTSVDMFENSVLAYISDSQINAESDIVSPDESLYVSAYNGADVTVRGGGLTFNSKAGLGASADVTIFKNDTKSFILNTTVYNISSEMNVSATTKEKVDSIVVSGSASDYASIAGSVLVVDSASKVYSYVQNSNIYNSKDVKISAEDNVLLGMDDAENGNGMWTGAVSASQSGIGVGGSVLVTTIKNERYAYSDDTNYDLSGRLNISSEGNEYVKNYLISGELGRYAGAGASITVNTIETKNYAFLSEGDRDVTIETDGDISVDVVNNVKLYNVAGDVSGGAYAGVGASVDVSRVDNVVGAYIGDGLTINSGGNVDVTAESNKDISSFVTAFTGGVGSVSGAVSVIQVGSGIDEDAEDATDGVLDDFNSQISKSFLGDDEGSTIWDENIRNEIDGETEGLDASSSFTRDVSKSRTFAYIGQNVNLTAKNSLTVEAKNYLKFSIITGQAAGGVVAAGGAVGLGFFYQDTYAYIDTNSYMTVDGNVDITSESKIDDSKVQSYQAEAGGVGIGAAVSVVKSTNNVDAFIGDNSVLINADDVNITGYQYSKILLEGFGLNVGGTAAAGVTYSTVSENGNVNVYIGAGSKIGDSDDSKRVKNVKLSAKAENDVTAKSRASSGGIVSGSGAVADVSIKPTLKVSVGTGTRIYQLKDDNNDYSVTLEEGVISKGYAYTFGVNVAGVTVGVSKSELEISPDMDVSIGDNVKIDGDNVRISVYQNGSETDFYGKAESLASAGNLLGAAAAISDVYNRTDIDISVGNSVEINASSINFGLTSYGSMYAKADGYNVGLAISYGDADSYAESDTSYSLNFGDNVKVTGDKFEVSIYAEDKNLAETFAASGGSVSGVASDSETKNIAKTTLTFGSGGQYEVDAVDVTVAHKSDFNSMSDSVNASVVGYSGAKAYNYLDTDVDLNVNDNVYFNTSKFGFSALNEVAKSNEDEYSVKSGSGGVFDGAAGESNSDLYINTNLTLGNNVKIYLYGDPEEVEPLKLTAKNKLDVFDKVKLDAGGAIVDALTKSILNIAEANSSVNVGENDVIFSRGDIYLSALTVTNLLSSANTSTYGFASSGQGYSKTYLNSLDSVFIGADSEITATKEMFLLSGADSEGFANVAVAARTNVYNNTAIAYSGSPDADAIADKNAKIEVSAGADVRSGSHAHITATQGLLAVSGVGHATDASKEALEKLAEMFGDDNADGALEIKSGKSEENGLGLVKIYGNVETGIYRNAEIVFDINPFNPYKDDGSMYGVYQDPDTGKWYLDTYEGRLGENDVELVPTRVSEGIEWTIKPDQLLASGIDAEIDRLQKILDTYTGGDQSYLNDIQTRIDTLKAMRSINGMDEYVHIIEVKDIYAASGNIVIWADYLSGDGTLNAPGDVSINVINNSPMPLQVDRLTIPDDLGGYIKFNGNNVTSNDEIRNQNLDDPALISTLDVNLNLISSANSNEPVINVENNFDKDVHTEVHTDNNPVLFVSKEISNLNGSVNLSSRGSVVMTAGIRANSVIISTGGDLIYNASDTLLNVGPNPAATFNDLATWYNWYKAVCHGDDNGCFRDNMNDMYNTKLSEFEATDKSFMVAANNIFINADTINVNGVIQSGIPYKDIMITSEDLDRARVTAIVTGQRYVTIKDVDPYLDIDKTVKGDITAVWDEVEKKIILTGAEISGGTVYIAARIANTGRDNGWINVLDGYGRINVVNETPYPVVLRNVDTGGVEGKVTIIDKAKKLDNGEYVRTEYTRINGEVHVKSNLYTVETVYNYTDILNSYQNGGVWGLKYNPVDDMRYYWMRGDFTSSVMKKKYRREEDRAVGFIPAGERDFSSSDLVYSETTELDSSELPQGDYLKTYDDGVNFRYESKTVESTSTLINRYDRDGSYWYWKDGWLYTRKVWYERIEYWAEGEKNHYYYNVKADWPININFVGIEERGNLNIQSVGDVIIENVDAKGSDGIIKSSAGSIVFNNLTGSIKTGDISFEASGSIGTSEKPVRIQIDPNSYINAKAGGEIAFHSINSDLNINGIEAANGDVTLISDKSIVMGVGVNTSDLTNPEALATYGKIKGNSIYLEAKNGAIKSIADNNIIVIDTNAENEGKLTALAATGDINLAEVSGGINIDTIKTSGNVQLTAFGAITDANLEEKEDKLSREELLALWGDLKLEGDAAEQKLQQQIQSYKDWMKVEYEKYWKEYRNLTRNPDGTYSYDEYDPNVEFHYSQDEIDSLKAAGWSDEQIADMEQTLTEKYREFGQDDYNPSFTYTLTDDEMNGFSDGHAWTDEELNRTFANTIFEKETTNTTLRVEAPNIVGHDIVINTTGSVGDNRDDIVFDYGNPDKYSSNEIETIMLALAAAERDDLEWDTTNNLLTIHQREDVDIKATGSVTVNATNYVFLGSEHDINVYAVKGGKIRIKTDGGIYDAAIGSDQVNIFVNDALVLEATNGGVGDVDNNLILSATDNDFTLSVRSKEDVYLKNVVGGIGVDFIYSENGDVHIFSSGEIFDKYNDSVGDISAHNIELISFGNVGRDGGIDEALEIKVAEDSDILSIAGDVVNLTVTGNANFDTLFALNNLKMKVSGDVNIDSFNFDSLYVNDFINAKSGVMNQFSDFNIDVSKLFAGGTFNVDSGGHFYLSKDATILGGVSVFAKGDITLDNQFFNAAVRNFESVIFYNADVDAKFYGGINSAFGDVYVTTQNDIVLRGINAPAKTVVLSSSKGAIYDGTEDPDFIDITAGYVVLSANKGIGNVDNPMNTITGSIAARNIGEGASGDIVIYNEAMAILSDPEYFPMSYQNWDYAILNESGSFDLKTKYGLTLMADIKAFGDINIRIDGGDYVGFAYIKGNIVSSKDNSKVEIYDFGSLFHADGIIGSDGSANNVDVNITLDTGDIQVGGYFTEIWGKVISNGGDIDMNIAGDVGILEVNAGGGDVSIVSERGHILNGGYNYYKKRASIIANNVELEADKGIGAGALYTNITGILNAKTNSENYFINIYNFGDLNVGVIDATTTGKVFIRTEGDIKGLDGLNVVADTLILYNKHNVDLTTDINKIENSFIETGHLNISNDKDLYIHNAAVLQGDVNFDVEGAFSLENMAVIDGNFVVNAVSDVGFKNLVIGRGDLSVTNQDGKGAFEVVGVGYGKIELNIKGDVEVTALGSGIGGITIDSNGTGNLMELASGKGDINLTFDGDLSLTGAQIILGSFYAKSNSDLNINGLAVGFGEVQVEANNLKMENMAVLGSLEESDFLEIYDRVKDVLDVVDIPFDTDAIPDYLQNDEIVLSEQFPDITTFSLEDAFDFGDSDYLRLDEFNEFAEQVEEIYNLVNDELNFNPEDIEWGSGDIVAVANEGKGEFKTVATAFGDFTVNVAREISMENIGITAGDLTVQNIEGDGYFANVAIGTGDAAITIDGAIVIENFADGLGNVVIKNSKGDGSFTTFGVTAGNTEIDIQGNVNMENVAIGTGDFMLKNVEGEGLFKNFGVVKGNTQIDIQGKVSFDTVAIGEGDFNIVNKEGEGVFINFGITKGKADFRIDDAVSFDTVGIGIGEVNVVNKSGDISFVNLISEDGVLNITSADSFKLDTVTSDKLQINVLAKGDVKLNSIQIESGNVNITDGGLLKAGDVEVGNGDMELVSEGDVDFGGVKFIEGKVNVEASGGFKGVDIESGGDFVLSSDGDVTIERIKVGGDFTVAGGGLVGLQQVDVAGGMSVNSVGFVSMDSIGVKGALFVNTEDGFSLNTGDVGSDFTLDSGKDVLIRELEVSGGFGLKGVGIDLGAVSVAGNLEVESSGGLFKVLNLNVGGSVSVSGVGDVDLSVVRAGGDFVMNGSGDIEVSDFEVGGLLNLSDVGDVSISGFSVSDGFIIDGGLGLILSDGEIGGDSNFVGSGAFEIENVKENGNVFAEKFDSIKILDSEIMGDLSLSSKNNILLENIFVGKNLSAQNSQGDIVINNSEFGKEDSFIKTPNNVKFYNVRFDGDESFFEIGNNLVIDSTKFSFNNIDWKIGNSLVMENVDLFGDGKIFISNDLTVEKVSFNGAEIIREFNSVKTLQIDVEDTLTIKKSFIGNMLDVIVNNDFIVMDTAIENAGVSFRSKNGEGSFSHNIIKDSSVSLNSMLDLKVSKIDSENSNLTFFSISKGDISEVNLLNSIVVFESGEYDFYKSSLSSSVLSGNGFGSLKVTETLFNNSNIDLIGGNVQLFNLNVDKGAKINSNQTLTIENLITNDMNIAANDIYVNQTEILNDLNINGQDNVEIKNVKIKSGDVKIFSGNKLDVDNLVADKGNINIKTQGNIELGVVDGSLGSVSLESSFGGIIDKNGDDINLYSRDDLKLYAGGGTVGNSANALEVKVFKGKLLVGALGVDSDYVSVNIVGGVDRFESESYDAIVVYRKTTGIVIYNGVILGGQAIDESSQVIGGDAISDSGNINNDFKEDFEQQGFMSYYEEGDTITPQEYVVGQIEYDENILNDENDVLYEEGEETQIDVNENQFLDEQNINIEYFQTGEEKKEEQEIKELIKNNQNSEVQDEQQDIIEPKQSEVDINIEYEDRLNTDVGEEHKDNNDKEKDEEK